MSRPPFVAMLTDLRKDERVDVIAEASGFNSDEVLGKLFRLWAWCTDRKLADAPEGCDGYAVPEAVIRKFLGPRGVEAMLGDGCDELAMGVRRSDGLIYLRGTTETVTRLRGLRATAAAGGRSAAGNTPRNDEGRFVRNYQNSQPTVQPEPAELQPSLRLEPAGDPAASSVQPQATATSHRSEEEPARSPPAPRGRKPPTGDHQRVIAAFETRYTERNGKGASWGATQGNMVKQLLAKQPADEIIRRIGILFDSPPLFLASCSPDLGTLVQHFDKLVAPAARAGPHLSAPNRNPVLSNLLDDIARREAAGET